MYATMQMNLENIMLFKKPVTKITYCIIPFFKCPEQENLETNKQINGCLGLGKGKYEGKWDWQLMDTGSFQKENIL